LLEYTLNTLTKTEEKGERIGDMGTESEILFLTSMHYCLLYNNRQLVNIPQST